MSHPPKPPDETPDGFPAAGPGAPAPRGDGPQTVPLLDSHTADALFVLDPEARVVFMNPAAERMFGWSQEELRGRVFHDVLHREHPDGRPFPAVECPVVGMLHDGEALTDHEDAFLNRDGAWVPVSCSSASIRMGGRVAGTTLVVRTRAVPSSLGTARRPSARALAYSDPRKDEFIAMLAHELRNPLGAVANAVALLRLRQHDAGVRQRAIDIIDRQVRHQARLVDELLDMSRLTRGKITLKRSRLDLTALVAAEVEDRRRDFEQAGLNLEVRLPPEPLWMNGDATRLAQVLGNLLSNAAKFTHRGGTVTVSLDRGSDGMAVLTVKDTGMGIDPAMLSRLFEPFAQADQSLDRQLGGLGLGLAMVRGLVALHGGTVRARSEGLMRGAEFNVVLPVEDGVARAEAAKPEGPPVAAASWRVLVIEDNQDAADSLRDMIELFGHQAVVAYNGIKGVEEARRFKPDIILCDVGLPGMDGYAVARTLRGEGAFSKTLLIAVSGYGQEEDRNRSRAAGFDLHLVKPVDGDDLERLLANPPSRSGGAA